MGLRVIMAVSFVLLSSSGAFARCASLKEEQSMSMRALQSELMVAALACGQRDFYNQFVRSSSDVLARNGGYLKAYFQRHYGGSGEYQLNKFVTQMANQASRVSLNSTDTAYCSRAAALFTTVKSTAAPQLASFAHNRYQAWHNTPSCEKAVVAQAKP